MKIIVFRMYRYVAKFDPSIIMNKEIKLLICKCICILYFVITKTTADLLAVISFLLECIFLKTPECSFFLLSFSCYLK